MLVYKRPWTRQPSGRGRLNAASFAPSALWNFSQRAEAASGLPVALGSNATWGVSGGASVLSVTGTSNLGRVTLAVQTNADKPGAGDFSVVIRFRLRSTAGYAAIARWNTGASAGSNDWLLGFAGTGGIPGNEATFIVECGATAYVASTLVAPWVNGEEYLLIGRRRGTTITVNRMAYSSRVMNVASTTNAGITTINSNSARALKLGELDGGAALNAALDASLVALFPRALSDDEVTALYSNSWRLFEPRRIWVPVTAAPTGPTVVAVTPTTIGSTSHRPRYTWTP